MEKKNILRKAFIIIAAVLLLLLGISKGDFADVRNKAIRICYECIGIG